MRNPYRTLPTLTFAEPIQADAGPFKVWLAPINEPSDDHRVIVDSLGWREPPLPFMASDSEAGHDDAVHVGNLSDFEIEDRDGTEWVTATLTYDSDETAAEFARLAAEGKFNGVSIHMGKGDFWPVMRKGDRFEKIDFDELEDLLDEADDPEEVWALIFDGVFDAEIAAATQVAIPAFPDSQIEEPIAAATVSYGGVTVELIEDATILTDENGEVLKQPLIDDLETVLAASLLDRPPSEWFNAPDLSEPTPLTVSDDGRVFGHLGLWSSCHTGYLDRCVRAPRGADYSAFLTSRVITDKGERVPVGPLVVDDGHAPASWSVDRVMSYYADTRLAAAYVTVGEDEHGVWVAGALSHKATPSQAETLRRHPLSGDWRPVDGRYRLIAAVSVNGPGFVVPEVLVADGEPVGLITYGPERESDLVLVASALEVLGAQMAAIMDRMDGPAVEAEAQELLASLG